MYSSTCYIGLTHVVNNQVVANEGWIARYFPWAPRFSQTNWRKNQEQKVAISAGPKWDFFPQPANPQPTTTKALSKDKKLTKQFFLPPSHRFSTQS